MLDDRPSAQSFTNEEERLNIPVDDVVLQQKVYDVPHRIIITQGIIHGEESTQDKTPRGYRSLAL